LGLPEGQGEGYTMKCAVCGCYALDLVKEAELPPEDRIHACINCRKELLKRSRAVSGPTHGSFGKE
jgi:hypothetical protein